MIYVLGKSSCLGVFAERDGEYGAAIIHPKALACVCLGGPRSECEWCNSSRVGQKWDADARMMVDVKEGCSRCGNSPV
jgi:hypothetical protein